MKIQTTAGELLAALAPAVSVCGNGNRLPMLENVLIEVSEDGTIRVIGTDLETELETSGTVDMARPGRVTVPAKRLAALVGKFEAETPITAEADAEVGALLIKAGRGRYRLPTLPAEGFPAFTLEGQSATITLPAPALAKLLDKTGFAMSVKDVRYYLNGLLLSAEPGLLRAVASDGHRLALSETPVTGEGGLSGIVPRRAVLEMQRLLKGQTGEAALAFAASSVVLAIGGVRLAAKLIEGRYPDYQRVMPRELIRRLDLNRDALVDALARVSGLVESEYKAVVVELADGTAELQIRASGENTEAVEIVPADAEGPAFEIGFNAAYLLDALGKVNGQTARLELTESCNAALVTDPADGSHRAVVMPMRV